MGCLWHPIFMGKWKHRLSSVNTETRTAICSNCGPVRIRSQGRGFYGCAVKQNAKRRIYKYKQKYGIDIRSAPLPTNCAICGGTVRIAYDHDHKTGKHRGWLCMKCNTALGLVNDDPTILQKMIDYLA